MSSDKSPEELMNYLKVISKDSYLRQKDKILKAASQGRTVTLKMGGGETEGGGAKIVFV